MTLKDILHSHSLRGPENNDNNNDDDSGPAASDSAQTLTTYSRSSGDAYLKGDEKDINRIDEQEDNRTPYVDLGASKSQRSVPHKAGKLERFAQKHGMHELGTEPQDVEQTKERNKLIAATGGIYIPSTMGNGAGNVKK